MLKAVIFDMDGVIVDSEPMHARAAVMAAKKYNVDISTEYCYGFIGSTTYYMCQRMVEDFQIQATPEELLQANEDMKDYLLQREGYSAIPYVIPLIKDLYSHGLKLIIASSSPGAAIESVMEELQIKEYFTGYVSGMNVPHPKPAPDIFLAAVSRLQLNAEECIVIEDSENGANAAFAAGITCIGYVNPNSGKQNLSKAAMLVEGFDEVDYDFVSEVYRSSHWDAATILTTDRLVIRELSVDDIDLLYKLYKEPDIYEFLDDFSGILEVEKEKQKAYINYVYQYYGFGLWGVFLEETMQLLGCCGIELKSVDGSEEYEIGYLIGKEFQGKGYAKESAEAVIQYFFKEHDVSRIIAVIDQKNHSSMRLAERLGMKNTGEMIRNQRKCYKYILNKEKLTNRDLQ